MCHSSDYDHHFAPATVTETDVALANVNKALAEHRRHEAWLNDDPEGEEFARLEAQSYASAAG